MDRLLWAAFYTFILGCTPPPNVSHLELKVLAYKNVLHERNRQLVECANQLNKLKGDVDELQKECADWRDQFYDEKNRHDCEGSGSW